jgi:hypothetical protein
VDGIQNLILYSIKCLSYHCTLHRSNCKFTKIQDTLGLKKNEKLFFVQKDLGLAPTTHLPTHPLVFWVGGQLKNPRKTPFCVKIFDLLWKKIQIILGYSNFL